jgi:hypothetical protein
MRKATLPLCVGFYLREVQLENPQVGDMAEEEVAGFWNLLSLVRQTQSALERYNTCSAVLICTKPSV